MTKKNSGNNQGQGSGGTSGVRDTATQQPVKPSDNGKRSIYNDNGGRKSTDDTTNSGGPRERG